MTDNAILNRNKALVRRFYADLDAGDHAAIGAVLHDEFSLHLADRPEPLDLAGFAEFGAAFADAFPDMRHTVLLQLAQGDLVATQVRFEATHQGAYRGIPATGNRVDVISMALDRLRADRILEHRMLIDEAGLVQQLTTPNRVRTGP